GRGPPLGPLRRGLGRERGLAQREQARVEDGGDREQEGERGHQFLCAPCAIHRRTTVTASGQIDPRASAGIPDPYNGFAGSESWSLRTRKLPSGESSPGVTRMNVWRCWVAPRFCAVRPTRFVYGSVERSRPLALAAPSREWQLIALLPVTPHDTRKRLLSMLVSFGSSAGQVRIPCRHWPAEQKAFAPQSASMPQSSG